MQLTTTQKIILSGGVLAVVYLISKRSQISAAVKTLATEWGRTGKKNLDATILPLVSASVAKHFPNDPRQKEIVRAMMAIANNESGERKNYLGVIGDTALANGPSVGPLQVYRSTAIGMGFVPKGTTFEQYKEYAYDLPLLVDWGVRVFKEKLRLQKNNIEDAIRAYNGSGPRAESYKQKALAFVSDIWGDLSA